ncbi:hypothetical protein ACQKP8_10735 [Photobacterium alginatilyticum]|uniref:hypothetical protein n=1 Tax=Photobacterium alginatilyticum TaxID=1775171 RepID=UPI0040682F9E
MQLYREMDTHLAQLDNIINLFAEVKTTGLNEKFDQLIMEEQTFVEQANDNINIKSEIERIDDIAKDNKHLVNHLAQTTDILSRQSSDLIEQVSKFTHSQ